MIILVSNLSIFGLCVASHEHWSIWVDLMTVCWACDLIVAFDQCQCWEKNAELAELLYASCTCSIVGLSIFVLRVLSLSSRARTVFGSRVWLFVSLCISNPLLYMQQRECRNFPILGRLRLHALYVGLVIVARDHSWDYACRVCWILSYEFRIMINLERMSIELDQSLFSKCIAWSVFGSRV